MTPRSTSATSPPPSSSWLIWLEWLSPRGERPGPRLAGVGRPPLLGARPPWSASPPARRQTNRPACRGTKPPSTLVDEATACLWGPGGGSALDYLRGRGLTEATVRAAGLGFTPAVMIPTRAGDRCFRFSGIVIPWRVRVVTIIGLLPITIIDGSSGLHTAEVPVASSLCS